MARRTTVIDEPRGPGRPRDPDIDARVLDAALHLLERDGYAVLTIERVATKAGVSRPTVYRRWPSKAHLLLDAVERSLGGARPGVASADTKRALLQGVSTLGRAFEGALGRALPAFVAELAQDDELAQQFVDRILRPRRASMAEVLRHGMESGVLDPHLDVEVVLDLLAGPLYYRALFRHAPASLATVRAVVELVWKGIALPK